MSSNTEKNLTALVPFLVVWAIGLVATLGFLAASVAVVVWVLRIMGVL